MGFPDIKRHNSLNMDYLKVFSLVQNVHLSLSYTQTITTPSKLHQATSNS